MAQIPQPNNTKKPLLPFTPTQDQDNNPTVCCACGRVSLGVGVGFVDRRQKDPQYVCRQCLTRVGDLTKMQRLNHYELRALDAAVDGAGRWIEENGNVTDLAFYDELAQRMFCKAIVEAFGDGVRAALAGNDIPRIDEEG